MVFLILYVGYYWLMGLMLRESFKDTFLRQRVLRSMATILLTYLALFAFLYVLTGFLNVYLTLALAVFALLSDVDRQLLFIGGHL